MNSHIHAREAAQMLQIHAKTLRRWDKTGVFVAKRDLSGQPFYTQDQIEDRITGGYRRCYLDKNGIKQCSLCKQESDVSQFYVSQGRPNSRCKTCIKIVRDKTRLPARYGITNEEYAEMRDAQGGLCAVCGKQGGVTKTTKLQVDHDHKTGKIRDLLCGRCNLLTGIIEANLIRVSIVQEYILAHQDWTQMSKTPFESDPRSMRSPKL